MPSSSENPFLQDLWNHLTEETQDPTSNKEHAAIQIYFRIKVAADKNPHLAKILQHVEEAAIRYARLVTGFTRIKINFSEGSASKEDFQRHDEMRRLAHNRLIDEINLLSREFKKAGIDNSWRNIIGFDRDAVGFWARQVAEMFIDEESKGGHDR